MKTKNSFYLLLFVIFAFSSCNTPKLGYFQDVQSG